MRGGTTEVPSRLIRTKSTLQAYFAANLLLYPSLAASKASVALLVIAIKPKRWIAIALYSVLGVATAWGIAAVFVTAFQCGPTRWVLGPTGSDTCIDQYAAQIGLKLVDMLTDVALAVLPAAMMATVQTDTEKRLIVAFMFGLRLVCVTFHVLPVDRAKPRHSTPICTAITLVKFSDFLDTPTVDRPFLAVGPTIWTSVTINVSLVTACLPSIKRWLTDWAAGVANAGILEPYEIQASSGHTNSRGAGPSGFRSFVRSRTNNASSKSGGGGGGGINMHSLNSTHKAEPTADDGDSKKGLTDGILQTVDYRVDYDNHRWN